MVLRRILNTSFIVVVLFSVVHNRKRSVADYTDIVKNISSVNNLLKNVIKNYKELENIAQSGAKETDDRTDSEIKQFFNVETGKQEGSFEDKITTKSEKYVRTPIFFSDESWREGESETIEKSLNEKENYDYIPTNLKKSTKARILAGKNNRLKVLGRNFKDDTESNGDDSSSDEISRFKPRIRTSRNPDHKKNIIALKGASKPKLKSHVFKTEPKHVSSVDRKSKKLLRDSNSDDEMIRKEVLRADYLRQAYMDACKIVLIRKCRRALRAVSKDVCSGGRKCTSKFKDDFRQNGMTACDQQFTNQTTACRSGIDHDEEGIYSVHSSDNRRLQVVINTKQPKKENSVKHVKVIEKNREMNILRDRYEKACKKDSSKKCLAACKNSYKTTCKKFECVDAKTNAFKKSCKRRCKDIFGVAGGDDDSDESDDSE